jgi:hypothetical protein
MHGGSGCRALPRKTQRPDPSPPSSPPSQNECARSTVPNKSATRRFEPHRYSRRNVACRLPARRGGSLTSRWTSDWTLELRGAVIALNSVPNPIRKRIMFGGKGLNRHVVQLGHICNVCQLRLRLPKRTRAHDTESNAGFEPLDVAEEAMERH